MRPLRPRLAVSAVLVLSAAIVPGPATGQTSPVEPYRADDRSVVALNILPPGQGRYLNSAELLQSQGSGEPVHNRDQLPLYSALIQSVPTLDEQKLDDLFKDASFGVKPGDIERQYEPRPGVVVLRDRGFGVPHIYGKTRSDTMFGAGYVTGEDRMFMIDVLRHVGRGRLTQLLGPSAANLEMDCAAWLSADYTEAELQAMRDRVPAGSDPTLLALANQARQDVLDFTAGINQYINEAMSNPSKLPAEYTALQIAPSPWKVTDTVAVAALIGSQFGVGGGNELRNAFFLDALEGAGHSPAEARKIFDDFRFADDPEAPVTADGTFPWSTDKGPIDPASQAPPDPGSFQDADDQQGDSCSGVGGFEASAGPPRSIDGPFGPIQLFQRRSASNALLVGPDLSKTGQPMAVFGPQVAYWSPEILMEIDMHGPGIDARGVGFPGISMYVLLGRGDGYGWSATSAGGDIVDIRTVKLCDPVIGPTINSSHYIRARDGQCVPIVKRTDTWLAKPTAGGTGLPENIEMTTERVELAEGNGSGDLSGGKWGIVVGRGEVDGDPVLFVQQRSTYGAEVDSAVAYVEIMNPDVINGPEDFHRAFGRFNYTFNWFYVDDHSIANQLVGAHPIRAQGADIDLPYWDGAQWKWQGFLDSNARPHVTNPAKGYITSWNNKQARGFRASDSNWSYGPVHRSQPLDDRIIGATQGDGKVDLVELVYAMGDAATVDIRGDKVLPYMLDVIGASGGPQVQQAVALLREWHEAGAHRRDQNGDGQYDHQAAVALMDEWWDRALDAVFGPVLGTALDDVPEQRHDAPGLVGSAFIGGWYGQLQKDLRSVLGQQPPGAFSRMYCGGGNLAACQAALAQSLQAAITDLGGAVGSWNYDERLDDIQFVPLGVNTRYRIPWQNRPTFQQVLQFGSLRGLGGCGGTQTEGLTQILGTDGPDRLVGTSAADVICAGGGRDRLVGLDGEDLLLGGGGKDVLRGGGDDDQLEGQGARDTLRGGRGDDVLKGGKGKDGCFGGPGRDRLRGCAKRRR